MTSLFCSDLFLRCEIGVLCSSVLPYALFALNHLFYALETILPRFKPVPGNQATISDNLSTRQQVLDIFDELCTRFLRSWSHRQMTDRQTARDESRPLCLNDDSP